MTIAEDWAELSNVAVKNTADTRSLRALKTMFYMGALSGFNAVYRCGIMKIEDGNDERAVAHMDATHKEITDYINGLESAFKAAKQPKRGQSG